MFHVKRPVVACAVWPGWPKAHALAGNRWTPGAPVRQPDLRADSFPRRSAHPPPDAPRSHRLRRLVRGPGLAPRGTQVGPPPRRGKGYGIDDPDGGLVSACVVTAYGLSGRPDLGAIGMVLVAERHARQGVGRRLMQHVVAVDGHDPLTLHATPYGRPLYEELGFKTTGRAEMMVGHFTPDGPGPASRHACGHGGGPHRDPPAGRGGLRHRPHPHDHAVARFADHLRVAEVGGRIIGYAAAWPNMDTHVVGPLIAQDTETAKALIASLAARTDRPLRTTSTSGTRNCWPGSRSAAWRRCPLNADRGHPRTRLTGPWITS